MGFPKSSVRRICLLCRRLRLDSWVRKICWRRERLPTSPFLDSPCDSADKESTCNAGNPGTIPGSGRSAGEGIGYPLQYSWASLVAQLLKNPPAMRETWVQSLGWEDPLEKGKATHSSILAMEWVAMSWTRLNGFYFHFALIHVYVTNILLKYFIIIACTIVMLFMGFSTQEYCSGLPFPSPVDHMLSDLSTMTLGGPTRHSLVSLS